VEPAGLERYLRAAIPLSRAMDVRVREASPEAVRLAMPLGPNINHRETLFGGSASAVCILAAWALVHVRLTAEGRAARIVIQRNTMEYGAPVIGEAEARASLPGGADWDRFVRTLDRRGAARIQIQAALSENGEPRGGLTGDFVALGKSR
jgi:thioesterase domain-containing protein